jgi:hypothetical protein
VSSLARLIEKTIEIAEVATTSSTDAISLDQAEKFSIQVEATVGDSIAHLEGSNDGENWDEIDSFSIAEGESDMFEGPNVSYRWARITLENDDIVDVSASCLVLVIGDSI